MVMNTGKDKEIKITEEVKNGQLQKVKEYKYLGVWINEGNNFGTNIRKIKEKNTIHDSCNKRNSQITTPLANIP